MVYYVVKWMTCRECCLSLVIRITKVFLLSSMTQSSDVRSYPMKMCFCFGAKPQGIF